MTPLTLPVRAAANLDFILKVHLPAGSSGAGKGYAFIHYEDPTSAVAAFQKADGRPFQGRLLHMLPAAAAKKEHELDDSPSQSSP